MNNIVELIKVNKNFRAKKVLHNVNLKITSNKITTIYGPSGSGKSTLLNIIGLLDNLNSGQLVLFNKQAPKINSAKARKLLQTKISYLFQNYALLNDQSIKKNLQLAKLDTKELKVSFEERKSLLLDKLNIEANEKTKVGLLSGGEQQRISFARCLLKPCELILCDEPTGSLDPKNREVIFNALKFAQSEGKTIVIVSHDPYIINNSDIAIDLRSIMD
ncbi:putative ABC transport system ATP-binding protein [Lactobacillus bombicola]|uniref:Putative ABC transport system ATP-binding protein n=1 Tax=Lactobacillus bombicola TaxID=1505723 RepID=A0A1I1SUB2_9LACO|nr:MULTISPECIES: ATP-binding cassette domain-containing protein [Lactobacillus]MCO6527578.1 ATP-binding cassette domain-containing protein [Lactobacillus sp.]RMC43313.1 ATP-binding cassette domain-containing protein [Lactobacillus sp. ESL0233]SFD48328.1 putative ABC transport system ATP-binding protein [Lactobacillus bombicola]